MATFHWVHDGWTHIIQRSSLNTTCAIYNRSGKPLIVHSATNLFIKATTGLAEIIYSGYTPHVKIYSWHKNSLHSFQQGDLMTQHTSIWRHSNRALARTHHVHHFDHSNLAHILDNFRLGILSNKKWAELQNPSWGPGSTVFFQQNWHWSSKKNNNNNNNNNKTYMS